MGALPGSAQDAGARPEFHYLTDHETPDGEPSGFYVWATDPEGESISYDVKGLPAFAAIIPVVMGDLDGDGFVTEADAGLIGDAVARRGRGRFDDSFDLNNDRAVDGEDGELVAALLGTAQPAIYVELSDPQPGTWRLLATATDAGGGLRLASMRIVIADQSVRRTYAGHEDVLVVINDESPVSRAIGDYFVAARRIPPEHVVRVAAPVRETITFEEFTETVRIPIEDFLTSRGLVDAINYIVTTKGVPLRVSGSTFFRASVDSELTLLLGPYARSIGGSLTVNPVAGSRYPFSRRTHGVYLVTRLTGYSFQDAVRLIDDAGAALDGRRGQPGARTSGEFVFDVDPSRDFGGYQVANQWLRSAAQGTIRAGHPTLLDETDVFVTGRDDVLGYASWGSNDANHTNHAIPGFTWLPGALAETFVSSSARTFTWPPTYGQSLVADLVAEGATGAKGYVYEPFLAALAHPDVLFDRYLRGYNLADSYYMASSFMSWMDVVVGDPKTRIQRDVDVAD